MPELLLAVSARAKAPCPPTPVPESVRASRSVTTLPVRNKEPPETTVVPPVTLPKPAALETTSWAPAPMVVVPV